MQLVFGRWDLYASKYATCIWEVGLILQQVCYLYLGGGTYILQQVCYLYLGGGIYTPASMLLVFGRWDLYSSKYATCIWEVGFILQQVCYLYLGGGTYTPASMLLVFGRWDLYSSKYATCIFLNLFILIFFFFWLLDFLPFLLGLGGGLLDIVVCLENHCSWSLARVAISA